MAWLRRNGLNIYAGLAILYMLIPIVVIAVFSFGETPKDKLTFALDNGFTTEYWSSAFAMSATRRRPIPSKEKGLVTTPTVSAPPPCGAGS